MIQGWYESDELDALCDAVKRAPDEGALVEIGVYYGLSASVLIENANGKAVHLVDDGRVGGILDSKVRDLPEVTFHEVDSATFRETWNQPIALLHIDADHSYEEVKADLELAKFVIVDGLVVLHDFGRVTAPGVKKAWEELTGTGFEDCGTKITCHIARRITVYPK